ncbi:MAG: HAD-IIB family hydrolase [bacterium]|nr:HAD-IIB family hydrolase [bacterium]
MFILATDLDRTLLPNGKEPYDGTVSELFAKISEKKFVLAYVTGRDLNLVLDAVKKYGIKLPDFLLAEVGTVMYEKKGDKMIPLSDWSEYVRKKTQNWNRDKIVEMVGMRDLLELQEGWKQNEFKVSFYLKEKDKKEEILRKIGKSLADIEIPADVIWSIDPLQNDVGLIDILPESATKVTALEFLRLKLGVEKEAVFYCGDSGNDLLPLTFGYKAIVVANAPEEVKEKARLLTREKGYGELLYIASGKYGNGNYSSGILEGLKHYGVVS